MSEQAAIKKELLIQLGALMAVSALLIFAGMSADKQLDKFLPEAQTWASTTNFKPSGMSAAYELLEKVYGRERRVKTWAQPYRKLKGSVKAQQLHDDDDYRNDDEQQDVAEHSDDDENQKNDKQLNKNTTESRNELAVSTAADASHGVLILVSPDQSLAAFEADEIVSWVRRGNALIYLDNFTLRSSRRILTRLGMTASELEPPFKEKLSDPQHASSLYNHLRQLKIDTDHSIKGGTPVGSVSGITVLAEKTVGDGKILIGSCPSFISNKHINSTDYWPNYQFISNWVGTTSGDILFDERCHGLTEGVNVYFYFLRGPSGWVLLQLSLILLVAVVSANQRFGARMRIADNRRISNLEHINGLSNTYQRANARQAIIEIIWQNLRLRLCRTLQISPHESNDNLVAELRSRGTAEADNIAKVAEKCQSAIINPNLSDDELRELVASCDKIAVSADRQLTTTGRNSI